MAMWLYQLSQKEWALNDYRLDVWEGEQLEWTIDSKTGPKAGDTLVFYYSQAGSEKSGFYGWGVILKGYKKARQMRFRPVSPSDRLKMHPWWGRQPDEIANKVRNMDEKEGLWYVEEEEAKQIREGIRRWAGGQAV